MKLIQLLLPAAMLLLSSHAFAGEFKVARVDIDFGEQVAEGNLIAAEPRIISMKGSVVA
jgi:hypothetical protein